ncbi:MAG: AEC family transporter [Spirochaetia bacterium]
MIISILLAIAEIFIFFLLGWVSNKMGLIKEEYIDSLTNFVIIFLLPSLIFSRIVINMDADSLLEAWMLPVLGLSIMALGGALGFIFAKGVREKDEDVIKTFRHFCAVNNYGFFPIIVIGRLWGDEAVAKLFLLNLGSYIGYWSIGVSLLGKGKLKDILKNLLNPPLIAVLLAAVVVFLRVSSYIPDFFMMMFDKTGTIAVPFVLILIGASLHGLPRGKELWDIGYLSLVRLVLIPAVTILLLLLLPLRNDVYRIAAVVSLMPVAVSSVVITRQYGGSPRFASHSAVITTMISAVTVPLSVLIIF